MDGDEECASRWAESMVLFERKRVHHDDDHDDDTVKELHVRRLWNKSRLLKRLDELRRASPAATRGASPAVPGYGNGVNGRMPLPAPIAVSGRQVRGEMWY
jgi:hypothetical protein